MIIRKHVAQVETLSYGERIDLYWTLAVSVDDCRPVLDGPEFRSIKAATEALDKSVTKAQQGLPPGVTVAHGEMVFRKSDLNPHGLI
jgi:hypothetical protein